MKQFDFSAIDHQITLSQKDAKMRPDDKYSMDKWKCVIRGESFDYFTGLGLRKDNQSVVPDIKAVLHSLFLDADCGKMTHAEFCVELGYDSDSIRAHKIWLTCVDTNQRLRKISTYEECKAIREALQDY